MATQESEMTFTMAQWMQFQTQLLQLREEKYELETEMQKKLKEMIKKEEEHKILQSNFQDSLKSMEKQSEDLASSLIAEKRMVQSLKNQLKSTRQELTDQGKKLSQRKEEIVKLTEREAKNLQKIKLLEKEKSDSKEEVKKWQDKLNGQRNEFENCKEALKKVELEKEELVTKVQCLSSENEQLQRNIDKLNVEKEENLRSIHKLTAEITESNRERGLEKNESNALQEVSDEVESMTSDSNCKISQLTEEIENLKKENSFLAGKLGYVDREHLQPMEEKLTSMIDENIMMEERLMKLKNILMSEGRSLEELDGEQLSEVSALEEELSLFQEIVIKLSDENKKLREEKQSLEQYEQSDKMKKKMHKEERNKHIEQILIENKNLVEVNKNMEVELEELKGKNEKLKEKIGSLKEELIQREKKVKEEKEEEVRIRESQKKEEVVEDVSIEISAKKENELKMKLETVENDLITEQKKVLALEKKLKDREKRVKELKIEMKKRLVELKTKDDKILKLDKQMQDNQDAYDTVMEKMNQILLEKEETKQEARKVETKLHDAELKLKKQQDNFSALLDEKQKKLSEELSKKNDLLEDNIKKLKERGQEVDKLRKRIVELEEKAKVSQNEVDTLKNSTKVQLNQIESFKTSIARLTDETAQNEAIHAEVARKLNLANKELNDKTAQIAQLTEELKTTTKTASNLEIVKSQNELLQSKLTSQVEKLENLKSNLAEEETKRLNLEKEKLILQEAAFTSKTEIDQLKHNLSVLELSVSEEKNKLQQVTEENENLKKELQTIAEMKTIIEEKDKTIQDINKDISDLKRLEKEKEMQHLVEQKQNLHLIKQLQNQVKVLGGNISEYSLLSNAGRSPSVAVGRGKNKLQVQPSTPTGSVDRSRNIKRTQSSNQAVVDKIDKNLLGSPTPSSSNSRRNSIGDNSPIVNTTKTAGDLEGIREDEPPPTLSNPNHSLNGSFSESEMLSMGVKLGVLQQTNFELEQQVNKLRVEVQKLREESSKKSRIIEKHLKTLKIQGRSTTEMDLNKREMIQAKAADNPLAFVGGLFGVSSEDVMQGEIENKMSILLEDTLMQNIQLQDDIKSIGEEVEKLMEENNKLKCQLSETKK